MHYRARSCTAPECQLRFPVQDGSPLGERCPICGEATRFVDEAYESHEVHEASPAGENNQRAALELLLDNVRSLSNVGSIFRSADGVGLRHIYVGGFTPGPEHPKLKKTALGAEQSVPSSRHRDPLALVEKLVADGQHRVWAIEGGPRSENLFDPSLARVLRSELSDTARPVLLVLGHEVSGIDPRILERADRILKIPMVGHKGSLNVGVAFGVVAYTLGFGLGLGLGLDVDPL